MGTIRDGEWMYRVNYIISYARENNALPSKDWIYYKWIEDTKKQLKEGTLKKSRVDYLKKAFPVFIYGNSVSDINRALSSNLKSSEGGYSTIVKVCKERSFRSNLYSEIMEKGLISTDDVLGYLKDKVYSKVVSRKKKDIIDFTKSEYFFFVSKYPKFYTKSSFSFKKLKLLYDILPYDFYFILFEEVNTSCSNGKYDLTYLNSVIFGVLSSLTDVERKIICVFYEIETGGSEKLTQKKVASYLGVSIKELKDYKNEIILKIRTKNKNILKGLFCDTLAMGEGYISSVFRKRIGNEKFSGDISDLFIVNILQDDLISSLNYDVNIEDFRSISVKGVECEDFLDIEDILRIRDLLLLEDRDLEIDLSFIFITRICNALYRAGIFTVRQLIEYSLNNDFSEGSRGRSFGKSALSSIYEFLYSIGYFYSSERCAFVDVLDSEVVE